MKDHMQFVCPHCFTWYHGDFLGGEQTRCNECGKVFNIVPHVTGRQTFERESSFRGWLIPSQNKNWKKCPLCKVEAVTHLGHDLGEVCGKMVVVEYHKCNSCNRTFTAPFTDP